MKYYVSCKKFTCYVETTNEGIILNTAPILKRFIGQNLDNLLSWCKSFGERRIEVLK